MNAQLIFRTMPKPDNDMVIVCDSKGLAFGMVHIDTFWDLGQKSELYEALQSVHKSITVSLKIEEVER